MSKFLLVVKRSTTIFLKKKKFGGFSYTSQGENKESLDGVVLCCNNSTKFWVRDNLILALETNVAAAYVYSTHESIYPSVSWIIIFWLVVVYSGDGGSSSGWSEGRKQGKKRACWASSQCKQPLQTLNSTEDEKGGQDEEEEEDFVSVKFRPGLSRVYVVPKFSLRYRPTPV